MTGDRELLDRYIGDASQEAFADLAARHLDLVYASARRQLHNEALAEDVTQAVFMMLAKKAATLRANVILPAWLLTATWYACKNAMRREHRRHLHEARVAAMNSRVAVDSSATIDDDGELSMTLTLLDRALMSLRERDRAAVTMHYLRGQTFEEVAAALHTTPEGARKRVERAIVKLRDRFASAGTGEFASTVVTSALIAAAKTQPPQTLLAKITAGASGSVVALAHGGLRAMTIAEVKRLCTVAVALVICISAGVAITRTGVFATTRATAKVSVAATKPSRSSGPLEALQQLAAAIRDGDGERFKSVILASNPADRAFVNLTAENIRLAGLFKSAYRTAFGDSAPEPLSAAWQWPPIPDTTPVFIAGERASIPLSVGTVHMVQDEGRWKLPSTGISLENQSGWPSSSQQAAELAGLNNLAYGDSIRGILEGRFKTPEQAVADLSGRLSDAAAIVRRHAKSATTTTPSSRRAIP